MAYNRVNNFIIKHKTLRPSQYMFCKHCSSEHALLDILGKYKNIWMKKYFLVAFLLIYGKLLIVLTTMFCFINYIIIDNVVSSSNGSAHI